MAVRGTELREPAEEIRRRRDRVVEEAVDRAARRMDADEEEREVLEEAAERVARRVTRPFVESAGDGKAARLFVER